MVSLPGLLASWGGMNQDMSMNGGTGPRAGGTLTDAIELRLPSRPEYLTLVRAAVGVIAGGMSFNYDEIIQLRVAVSEAVQMTMRRAQCRNGLAASDWGIGRSRRYTL